MLSLATFTKKCIYAGKKKLNIYSQKKIIAVDRYWFVAFSRSLKHRNNLESYSNEPKELVIKTDSAQSLSNKYKNDLLKIYSQHIN